LLSYWPDNQLFVGVYYCVVRGLAGHAKETQLFARPSCGRCRLQSCGMMLSPSMLVFALATVLVVCNVPKALPFGKAIEARSFDGLAPVGVPPQLT
jgi:hypothetical protein